MDDGAARKTVSDSVTILGLWVLRLAVSHINEFNCKLISPEHYFNDKSAILLHPGTRWIKNFASKRQNHAQKMQDAPVTKSLNSADLDLCRFLQKIYLGSARQGITSHHIDFPHYSCLRLRLANNLMRNHGY